MININKLFDKLTKEKREELNNGFLKSIKEASINIIELAPQSPKKIQPIHIWLASALQELLGVEFEVYASGFKKYPVSIETPKKKKMKTIYYNEVPLSGKYFNKNVDIGIFSKKRNQLIGAVEVKFHFNNLSQNENNNIENMLGYTSNVRGNNMLFANLVIAREKTPYLLKGGNLDKVENHGSASWEKYEKILQESPSSLHRPDSLCISVVNLGIEDWLDELINSGSKAKIHKNNTPESNYIKENINPSFSKVSPHLDFDGEVLEIDKWITNLAIKLIVKSTDIY